MKIDYERRRGLKKTIVYNGELAIEFSNEQVEIVMVKVEKRSRMKTYPFRWRTKTRYEVGWKPVDGEFFTYDYKDYALVTGSRRFHKLVKTALKGKTEFRHNAKN